MSSQFNSVKSFESLIEKSAAFDALKHDTIAPTSKLSFGQDGRLIVPAEMGSLNLGLEDTALCQLSDRLGKPFWETSKRTIPTDFYRQMHDAFPSHFANLTNELLNKMDGKLLIRGYDNDVRAILSDRYTTLDNTSMLEMASQVLDGIPFNIVESGKYYSRNDGIQRDEMSVRVMVKHIKPEDDDSSYGLGVMIRNGETGGGASEVRPLVWRTSCFNSIIFKQGENGERAGLRLTHLGSKQAKINLLASAIAEALPMAEQGLEKFLLTKQAEIDLAGVIAKLGQDQNWSEEIKLSIAAGSEGRNSVYGLVNGITFAAHELDLSTFDRFNMESLASKFVYEPALARA